MSALCKQFNEGEATEETRNGQKEEKDDQRTQRAAAWEQVWHGNFV